MSLTARGKIKINNSQEFDVKNINPRWESIQTANSGRSDDGVMHIFWVKRKVRKLEITLPPSTASQVNAVLSLVQGQEYTLTYFDPLANAEKTINVYTSNSSANMYSGVLYNGLWQDVTFNAIELGGE